MKTITTKLLSAFQAVVLRVMRPCVQLQEWLRQHSVKWQVNELLIVTRSEGEMLPPFWYGHAYLRWDAYVSVFYPIPLNYLVRWGMALIYIWNRHRGKWSWVDEQVDLRFKKESEHYRIVRQVMQDKERQLDQFLRRAEMAMFRAEAGATTSEKESHGA